MFFVLHGEQIGASAPCKSGWIVKHQSRVPKVNSYAYQLDSYEQLVQRQGTTKITEYQIVESDS